MGIDGNKSVTGAGPRWAWGRACAVALLTLGLACGVCAAQADASPSTNPTRKDPVVDIEPTKGTGGSTRGVSKDPFSNASLDAPSAIVGMEVVEYLGKRMPLDAEFLDHAGKAWKLERATDGTKPVIVALVYFRCPMLCQLVMQKLASTLHELDLTAGKDFQLVVASFDPTETPEMIDTQRRGFLASYGRDDTAEDKARVERGVHFVATKTTTETRRLADALGFPYRYLPESGEYSHGTVIFVLTPDGTASRYIYGVQYPVKNIRLALIEAGQGKIGTTIDRAIMWCFQWNPGSNSYVITAFRWMQFGSGLTLAIVVSVLTVLWMSERQRRAARASLLAAQRDLRATPGGAALASVGRLNGR